MRAVRCDVFSSPSDTWISRSSKGTFVCVCRVKMRPPSTEMKRMPKTASRSVSAVDIVDGE